VDPLERKIKAVAAAGFDGLATGKV